MENAVEIKELTKKYKDFTLDVSAVIPKGFASALIGANGAGKTTLIDTLCGVTAKTGGEAVYFGNMTDTDDDVLRNRIGYCSATNFFPFDWKLKTIAECMAIGYDSFDRARFTELCAKWSLGSPDDKKQKNMMKMSDGNRMRAALAAVLARDTDLLVLDEPASSLDPLARDQLCEMFREYLAAKDGERTILFSTHNIADMEFATDYAIFMAHGKVVEQGFVEDLKEKYIQSKEQQFVTYTEPDDTGQRKLISNSARLRLFLPECDELLSVEIRLADETNISKWNVKTLEGTTNNGEVELMKKNDLVFTSTRLAVNFEKVTLRTYISSTENRQRLVTNHEASLVVEGDSDVIGIVTLGNNEKFGVTIKWLVSRRNTITPPATASDL